MGIRQGTWVAAMWVVSLPLWTRGARTGLLRLLGVSVARTASIADHVRIGSRQIVVGDGSFVNCDCFLDGCAPLVIDEGVSIGPRVIVLTGSHSIGPETSRADRTVDIVAKPVRIKRGSWIGAGAIILPGVTVAEGCVIGAGSVVSEDTEALGLYAGAPARRLKSLPV